MCKFQTCDAELISISLVLQRHILCATYFSFVSPIYLPSIAFCLLLLVACIFEVCLNVLRYCWYIYVYIYTWNACEWILWSLWQTEGRTAIQYMSIHVCYNSCALLVCSPLVCPGGHWPRSSGYVAWGEVRGVGASEGSYQTFIGLDQSEGAETLGLLWSLDDATEANTVVTASKPLPGSIPLLCTPIAGPMRAQTHTHTTPLANFHYAPLHHLVLLLQHPAIRAQCPSPWRERRRWAPFWALAPPRAF